MQNEKSELYYNMINAQIKKFQGMKNSDSSTLNCYKLLNSGKVRDTYDYNDGGKHILSIATDKVSGYDVKFYDVIPYKGIFLTLISNYFKEIAGYYKIDTDIDFIKTQKSVKRIGPNYIGRTIIAKKLQMLPFETIVRGYHFGSIVKEYNLATSKKSEKGEVFNEFDPFDKQVYKSDYYKEIAGNRVPCGLQLCDKYEKPIFTPSTKAEYGKHDENITRDQMREMMFEMGYDASLYDLIESRSLRLYKHINDVYNRFGLTMMDTKFEWGIDPNNPKVPILGDEVGTPDSSRIVLTESLATRKPISMDKQVLRDFMTSLKAANEWNPGDTPPEIPADLVLKMQQNYATLVSLLYTKFNDTTRQKELVLPNNLRDIVSCYAQKILAENGGK
ncbi:MAG: phosphoribosylaminoimidazolesuccinocarboxamide synthase [Rickettsiales bacterium]|jgi:phosphoribosylaminoimidazole-succinocarboxamide synthase|nr:phosphoribosylaminoimidazolesuccinocarboxamide synthase [Rickettsiales bacterium]